MKMTFVTVSAAAVKQLIEAGRTIKKDYGQILELKIYYTATGLSEEKQIQMEADIESSHLVFIDLMGSPGGTIKAVYKALEHCSGHIIPYGNSARHYLKLGSFTAETMKPKKDNKKMDMASMKKMQAMAETMGKVMPGKMRDMKNYSFIMKYFKSAFRENILNMLILILKEYGGEKALPSPGEPKEYEGVSICRPETMERYDSLKEYEKSYPFQKEKPVVVLMFYGHTYPTDTSGCVSAIKNKIEKFANVLPIAVSGTLDENNQKLEKILLNNGKYNPDLIVNFMSFRLGAGPMGGNAEGGIEFLKKANVPYFHPFFMTRRTAKEWTESVQGCSSSEIMISVMLPELDGCIETFPIAAMGEPRYDKEFDTYVEELEIIEERADRLAQRIKGQLTLKCKKNQEKKIAVLCYNYPPGESNLFGGAFLDTFASVANLLKVLKDAGYNTQDLNKEELMDIFSAGKAVNSGKYGGDWDGMIAYNSKKYKKKLETSFQHEEMLEQWGEVPGEIMAGENKEFFIPGTIAGNVFIGLQPSRGIHEDTDKTYHDKTLLPHHQYQAFYQWIREEFQADALIHVGTHGTLEFLKGKECGLSGECYGDMLLEDVPHMYLYYCGNPSEAMIAKRRSNANIISYQPPVFVPGELYGEYVNLMSLTDNYHQALAIAPDSAKTILSDILAAAGELNISGELEEIESELYRINSSLIPQGLHVFGECFSEEEAESYVRGLLGYDRGNMLSLRSLTAKARGMDMEELLQEGNYTCIRELDDTADRIYRFFMDNGNIRGFDWIPRELEEEFIQTLEYGRTVKERVGKNFETEGLLKTLSAQYNPSRMAGDIYRNPEILPSGSNIHQFDPRLIPTAAAYDRGARACENIIQIHQKEKGEFPKSTAVILWGLETSRTQGETLSQILALLGVKISKKGSIWEPKYEIIPMEELKRPRIDVIVNICGFFRDMFPNIMDSLQELFVLLYELEEKDEENYFKANSKKIYKKLVAEGYEEDQAAELAVSRIFGPKEGEYGTGLTKLIETRNWEEEEQFGTLFMNKLQHVYSKSMRGRKVEGLYEENLKSVELVSQIRSNHEYQITDLDHYYEFFGGLAKSIEMVKGEKAGLYITDTTQEQILTETAQKSIARGIRTRVLNPKWIEGMLAHEYHGVQKIAERFENIMGLAATTNSVEEWIYNDMHSSYVEDEELSNKLKENNPYAYMDILEQMMEYSDRGYWDASEEQLEKIKERYLELEDDIEEKL